MPASRPTLTSQRTGGHGQQCHRSWQLKIKTSETMKYKIKQIKI